MPRQIKKVPQCIYGNVCTAFCVNPQCKKPCFICQKGLNNRGQCGLFHENCQKMSWSDLDNIIYQNPNTKTPDFSDFIQQMENMFSGLIRKIKQEHLKFRIFVRTFGYSDDMMKFIKQINQEDFDRITGNRMNEVISELFMKDQKRKNRQFSFQKAKFQTINDQIYQNLEKLPSIYQNSQIDKSKLEVKQKSIIKQNPMDSSISNDFQYIKSLFQKQKVKKLQKIYRASENNFSAEAFHSKCDGVKNTIVLIETQFGKVIGGYTSLAWNSSKKHWATDKQLTSFIFSISMKEKFNLNLAQFAIACNPKKGPIFGCCDICIVDRSDRQKCNAQFPISYSNFKHTRSTSTNIQFIGNQLGKFRTKEWEVFQVIFQQ